MAVKVLTKYGLSPFSTLGTSEVCKPLPIEFDLSVQDIVYKSFPSSGDFSVQKASKITKTIYCIAGNKLFQEFSKQFMPKILKRFNLISSKKVDKLNEIRSEMLSLSKKFKIDGMIYGCFEEFDPEQELALELRASIARKIAETSTDIWLSSQ